MNLDKFEIGKFNKQEIEIINNFIKIYNPNYKGDLEEFIKNPKITRYINKESNISENEISHVFNELNENNKIMFDPLFRFYKNADSYMLFLSLYEIRNNDKCVFVISNNELIEMSDENKDKYYSYYLHVKLMFECADVYNYITYEDFEKMKNKNDEVKNKNDEMKNKNDEVKNENDEVKNKNDEVKNKNDEVKNKNDEVKYILLCPYLFMINSHKIEKLNENVEFSQDIPYTDSNKFNEFIFKLWNNMIYKEDE